MKNHFARVNLGQKRSKIFKKILRPLGLILSGVLLAGCPASDQSAALKPAPAAPNKVVIRGSNTIGEELAPKLVQEFKKDHANVEFDILTKATGYGLAALRGEECDIAAASRFPSKEEQEEARAMNVELVGSAIGAYSVAVVVNRNNAVTNLTKAQVRDIFTGKIANWKEVGGLDAPIHLYVRDPISGTYLGFNEVAMENQHYASGRKLATSYAAIAQAVAQDETGIGYTGIGGNEGVKPVAIDGVTPSPETINGGKYPYTRNLYFYVNKNHESAAAKEFVQYVLSGKGQQVVAQLGFVPHP